ncbi:UNVERIFIED_CONTAM: hypothetical protein Sangu_0324700 [Sesamum angustifolium]|uniref:AB hydrolase-1 domain-containing protein n=1 Tax=Sesamum angustifolium TaxID=2727405 RepID=A0AAW2QQM3_9LAMI
MQILTSQRVSCLEGEFAGLLDEDVGKVNGYSYSYSAADGGIPAARESGDWRFQVAEFAKGAAEMSVEFGKGVRDVVKQSVLREDSVIVRKFKGPCLKIMGKLRFLNEYLPEDRDPVHSWTVIACVWLVALAALIVNITETTTPLVKKMKVHPTSASLILLPDGRRLAYQSKAFQLTKRGIPGLKGSLLQDFGVRLVTYDLPGFGESDPHPDRDLESSALDMLHLSYSVNITDKFWVVGYSDGSKHAWAALRYIPDRLAGAIMVAPMINPYEPKLTKEERRRIWGTWTIDTWHYLSLGKWDRALVKDRIFEDFWQRDVEESVRQGNAKPFVEEAALQVSNWGFSIADLKVQNKHNSRGILALLKSVYSPSEQRLSGFLGPIHIWQGAEDTVVPPAMSHFVHRVLPYVMLHKLPYEGHFTYFYFCDECHRQMFSIVYGDPQGPLLPKEDHTPIEEEEGEEENKEVIFSDTAADNENVSTLA